MSMNMPVDAALRASHRVPNAGDLGGTGLGNCQTCVSPLLEASKPIPPLIDRLIEVCDKLDRKIDVDLFQSGQRHQQDAVLLHPDMLWAWCYGERTHRLDRLARRQQEPHPDRLNDPFGQNRHRRHSRRRSTCAGVWERHAGVRRLFATCRTFC
jgi:hypothetical protein